MHGLDPEHVLYAGTASKSIAPGIGLGALAVGHAGPAPTSVGSWAEHTRLPGMTATWRRTSA